jgi:hypothetical protein
MTSYPDVHFKNAATGKDAFTRIGGVPEWIQCEWLPECCGTRMQFLAQIDSLDIPEAELPDCALIYVFVCTKCFDTACQLQCC